jgi:ABC-type transporter MlaC component
VKPALLVLPLLVAAACSGSSSSDAAAQRSSYVQEAEAICQQANADQKALTKPTSAKQLSPYVDAVVQIADRSTTALLKLSPPAEDKKDLEQHVFTPLHQQLVLAREYADKVRSASKGNDQVALVKLLSDPPNQTAADLVWMRKYGFKECVTAADTSG